MSRSLDLLALGEGTASDLAVICPDGTALTHGALRSRLAECRTALSGPAKALVVVASPRTLTGLVGYLAAVETGHAVILTEESDLALTSDLIAAYAPELIITMPTGPLADLAAKAGYRLRTRAPIPVWKAPEWCSSDPIHPDLALLVRTSGSLGAAKTVRLSFDNLRANALAIADALRLRGSDRTMTALPLDYSFGLSMVNSALVAGGAVALGSHSPSSSLFWDHADEVGATCVGAVPTTYKLLRARGWDPGRHPSLRLLLHAGGALGMETFAYHHARMTAKGGEFISMYGQTEATARIACLPAALAPSYSGSVGSAIPGGRITIEKSAGVSAADGDVGQIVFEGPNVMMGYAMCRGDLAAGDMQGSVLRTGDLGYLRDGYLYVTGRMDRQVKVLGRRIDLDQLEKSLEDQGLMAAMDVIGDEQLAVVAEPAAHALDACRAITSRLRLPSSSVRLITIGSLPYTGRGKIDRPAVRRILDGCALRQLCDARKGCSEGPQVVRPNVWRKEPRWETPAEDLTGRTARYPLRIRPFPPPRLCSVSGPTGATVWAARSSLGSTGG
jgi:long-chain acyl-CoA synthetase